MEHKFYGECALCGKEVTATCFTDENTTPLYLKMKEKQWQRDVHICKDCQLEWYLRHAGNVNLTTGAVMDAIDTLNHVTGTRFTIMEKFDKHLEALRKLIKGKVAYLKESRMEVVIGSIYSTELEDSLWITALPVNHEQPWTTRKQNVAIGDDRETCCDEVTGTIFINVNDLEFTDEVFTERNEIMNKLYRKAEDDRKASKH